MSLRKTTQQFINEAQAVHGVGKYDYSQAEYIDNKKALAIMCLRHGLFKQAPGGHLSGKGCWECFKEQSRTSQNDFIAKAKEVWGGRYDYSKTNYNGSNKKVTIGCAEHGCFEQVANSFLKGFGCPKCSAWVGLPEIKLARFIAKARSAHGERYDYSQAQYTRARNNIKIVCPEHGAFEQSASRHTRGAGCGKCAEKFLRQGWVQAATGSLCTLYLLRVFDKDEVFYKIGITSSTVASRYRGRLLGYKYEVLAQYKSTNAAAIFGWEQSILDTFAHLRHRPKNWFAGESECFSSAEEILSIFPL